MISIEFTPEDIDALEAGRFEHPDKYVRRRLEMVYLKSQGLAHGQIQRLMRIGGNTLRRSLSLYQHGGLAALQTRHPYRPQSTLVAHRERLQEHFKAHPPATVKLAQAQIQELTDIERRPTQVAHFLKCLGLKCRKVGMVPAKADPQEQARFLKEKLQPRLDEAQAGARAVFFVDAAHFVLGALLGYLWSACRLFVPGPSGRRRLNVLGALHALTHQLITVENTTYINAQSVCELLRKLAALGLGVPITLVLDNAPYQRCELVRNLAQELGIELLFLPPYSPNLNLIERVWKFVKKKTLYSKYYPDFPQFQAAILGCIEQLATTYKSEMDSLLTLRFQTFENVQVMTA